MMSEIQGETTRQPVILWHCGGSPVFFCRRMFAACVITADWG